MLFKQFLINYDHFNLDLFASFDGFGVKLSTCKRSSSFTLLKVAFWFHWFIDFMWFQEWLTSETMAMNNTQYHDQNNRYLVLGL